PRAAARSRLRLFALLAGRLLRRDFLVHLGHVERFRLGQHLLERVPRQRARLLEEDDLLAEHHQRRDRADTKGTGELLLLVGIDLAEYDVRMAFRRLLEDRRETATRAAPGRPEVDHDHRVVIDSLLEVFAGEIDGGHDAVPFGWDVGRGMYSRQPCMSAG